MSVRDRYRPRLGEGGFTLIEIIVAISLAAFVFLALAGAMIAGLRSLAIQKARTQGNEVATQGIEDLQRLSFDDLGTCGDPPEKDGAFPVGFDDPAMQAVKSNCPAPVNQADLGNPCTPLIVSIPSMSYQCTRNNVVYNVRRYISWGDEELTTKRMAVFVDWTDNVGEHTVSQQSSLRTPTEASIIGIAPPDFVSVSVTDGSSADDGGKVKLEDPDGDGVGLLADSLTFNATTTGLFDVTADHVSVIFTTLVEIDDPPGSRTTVSQVFDLTGGPDGDTWTGTIPAGHPDYQFGIGTQFFVFTALRADDGKGNSRIALPAKQFCTPSVSGCSSSAATAPTLSAISVFPSTTVDIDPGGVLIQDDFEVRVSTTNISTEDSVRLTIKTQSGSFTVPMSPNTSCGPAGTEVGCMWSATISRADALRFPAGNQNFFVTAAQVYNPDPPHVDKGSTVAAQSGTVTFQ